MTIEQNPVRFTTKAGEECWCVGGGGVQGCCPYNAIPLKSYINGFHFKELGQKKIESISPLYKHHHVLDEMLCLRPLSSERRFWTRSCGGPEAMTSNIVGKLHSEGVIAPNELYANMNQESSPWSWDAQDSKGNFIKDKKMAVQEIQLYNLNPHI
ncbi:hypothetical protein PSTG_04947 [Puccinia striiformis f. sp. tritici PST-78]|uniref:Uncharacterized protein n=1 Tax=Puccinia striiformis f. sp. tritici PST-78 TaxID=1165861 RepID=A0A0L0VRB6_9BASI|nr:hypothetical protein PSTG_04947 [Puccinia striiformis f. sp. tritici PST-78]